MKEESDWRETLKKILRAFKAVLLSSSKMDYQVELEEMKASRFKLIFIVLTTATIIWIIMFYTRLEYFMFIMGLTLFAGWLGFVVVAIDKFLKREKPTVNPLEACSRLALKEGQKENQTEKGKGEIKVKMHGKSEIQRLAAEKAKKAAKEELGTLVLVVMTTLTLLAIVATAANPGIGGPLSMLLLVVCIVLILVGNSMLYDKHYKAYLEELSLSRKEDK